VEMGKTVYLSDNKALKEEILRETHESRFATHPESTKMYKDLKEYYWRPNMKKKITKFMAKGRTCQQVKVKHQKPVGKLQPLSIPEWKWKDITMNFMLGLPRGKKGNDVKWVVMDKLTKLAMFLPMTDSVDKLTRLYVNEVIILHRVLISIVLDQDPRAYNGLWELN
jgi:hypothetical protein